jgi:hypothetical protein
MESKGLPIHSPRSPIHGETLARCTRAVYPPRFLRTAAHRWASVFHWLWFGHMYMESNGLPMHSPRSPVYSETLPPIFLRTTAHRWASVFFWLWLDHMYMERKCLSMHRPRIPVYGETLARCTRAVYSLNFSGRRHTGGLVCFFGFGFGHMYMETKGLPMHSPQSPVYSETLPLDFAGQRYTGGLVCFFVFG